MVSCRVQDNIYSADGKVLLIERGSEASGEYQSDLKRGQARIFVVWDHIRTPSGIDIPIASLGTDELGGSGIPGFVDDHFWQRYGGGLLVSFIQDVSKGLSERIANSNNRISLNNTESSGSGMAVEALKNSINIPPTLYKNHGDEVGIYIARDLNFREVYDLQLK